MGSRAPLGSKSLWKTAGLRLPGYVREVARALMRDRGMSKSHAIEMAYGRIRAWAAGRGKVSAKTRAKAAAAVAQFKAAQAKAHATPNKK